LSPVARSVRRTLCFMPHITMCAAEDREAGLTVRLFFPHAFPRAFLHGGLSFLLDGVPVLSCELSLLPFLFAVQIDEVEGSPV
jgi:hypothetical protein